MNIENNNQTNYSWTQEDQEKYLQHLKDQGEPIYRGYTAAENGGCYCTGSCREIIGYKNVKDKV